jgi:hypothetical protein
MTRENAAAKADRLLLSGRLIVTAIDPMARTVAAVARGEGTMHRLAFSPSHGWTCTCPARRDRCSHLQAVRRCVAVDLNESRGGAT